MKLDKPVIYETVVTVSVLGNDPYDGGLEHLSAATMDGDFSGYVRSVVVREVVDRTEQQALCDEHGSDIAFFGEEFAEGPSECDDRTGGGRYACERSANHLGNHRNGHTMWPREIVKPAFHLGGSSGQHMLEDWGATRAKVEEAYGWLRTVSPHMRDYYHLKNGRELYDKAVEEHSARMQALQDVSDELEQLMEHALKATR